MPAQYLLLRWFDGRTGAVLEADALDVAKADLFKGAVVSSWEDGSHYAGAATFLPADEVVLDVVPEYLVVEWTDGREAGVLPDNYVDPAFTDQFAGSVATTFESGEVWEGP